MVDPKNKNWVLHGYFLLRFLQGSIVGGDGSYITWEGKNNVTYNNITKDLFATIDGWEAHGKPKYNWKLEDNSDIFTAFDGFCKKVEINTTNMLPGMFFVNLVKYTSIQNRRIQEEISEEL